MFITPSLVKLSFQQPLPKSFGNCRLVVVRGQYYLCLPVDAPKHQIENKQRIVALDPGAIILHKRLVAEVTSINPWYYEMFKYAP